jgi:hypothetical protein
MAGFQLRIGTGSIERKSGNDIKSALADAQRAADPSENQRNGQENPG